MKTVLAPLDFSGATPRVVEEAARLAQAIDGKLVLLHIARVPDLMPHFAGQMAHLGEAVREIEATADRQLLQITEELKARGVHAQSVRVTGEPKRDIVDQAEKLGADLIVIGSRGHSALHDLMVGSVTSAVIKRASGVVVVVPPPKKPAK